MRRQLTTADLAASMETSVPLLLSGYDDLIEALRGRRLFAQRKPQQERSAGRAFSSIICPSHRPVAELARLHEPVKEYFDIGVPRISTDAVHRASNFVIITLDDLREIPPIPPQHACDANLGIPRNRLRHYRIERD